MEKQIFINGAATNFWIEDTGRLRNSRTKRWLKGGINKGYHFYSIYFRGKQYIFYTHRLVAEYFIPNPNNYPIVHHKDGDKLNNFYLNLEWIDTKEHSQTIKEMGQRKSKIGSRQYLTEEDLQNTTIAQFRNSPYYATTDGRIFNLSKNIEMRQEKSGNYYRITTQYNLKGKHFLVHRLIWEAFNGPIPKGYDIDHLDGNPANNNLNNLEMVTHKENIKRRNMDFDYVVDNFYRGK